jgi:predicted transcriptional regulator of viral defense system
LLKTFRDLRRPIFTTREFAGLRGVSLSSASQTLKRLESRGHLLHMSRGLWCDPGDPRFSPLGVVPFLVPHGRAYVSFLTALHLHGVIEQIPQTIEVAATAHGKRVVTPAGTFELHKLDPRVFDGFDWYGDRQDFLIASPEKALVDCLYLSTRRGKRFRFFPELSFPRSFSSRRAQEWALRIPDPRVRSKVAERLEALLGQGAKVGRPARRRR